MASDGKTERAGAEKDARGVINGKLIRLANAGDPRAQSLLGRLHLSDDPEMRDEEKAFKWFRAAADQGLTEAQIQVGLMFLTGVGVKKDPEEAAKLYCTAGLKGATEGFVRLAMMFFLGNGIDRDLVSAYAWFSAAAMDGRRDAAREAKSVRRLLDPAQKDEAERLISKIEDLKKRKRIAPKSG